MTKGIKGSVNVMGVKYTIKFVDDSDHRVDGAWGVCCFSSKEILILDLVKCNYDYDDLQEHYNRTIRHEITHAFLYESGLDGSSLSYESSWSRNEEMIDWIAIQGVKLHKAWVEVGVS